MARSETIPMRVGAPPISSEDPGGASVFYKTAITVVLAFLYAAQSIVRSNDLLCSAALWPVLTRRCRLLRPGGDVLEGRRHVQLRPEHGCHVHRAAQALPRLQPVRSPPAPASLPSSPPRC